MDAFVKIRRTKRVSSSSSSSNGKKEEQKESAAEQKSQVCNNEHNTRVEKQAWPLYIPVSGSSVTTVKSQRSEPSSSGYLPDFSSSSCSSASSCFRPTTLKRQRSDSSSSGLLPDFSPSYCSSASSCGQRSCSSPLSDDDSSEDDVSLFCNDIEATIQRAQNQKIKYNLAVAAPLNYAQNQLPLTRQTSSLSLQEATRNNNKSPLLAFDSNILAGVLTYLEPQEILKVLTMPICKEWHQTYGSNQELWRILCLMEPFCASTGSSGSGIGGAMRECDNHSEFDDSSSDEDDEDSFCSVGRGGDAPTFNNIFGKYRLMYTSFVRCRKYLMQIREDSRNGKSPSASDHFAQNGGFPQFGVSKGLKKFLARKKGGTLDRKALLDGASKNGEDGDDSVDIVSSFPIGVSDDDYSNAAENKKRKSIGSEPVAKKVKYGNSMITKRLLGPSSGGQPSYLNLPTSCAIYSLVNWMVAYPEVEGIQTMCIETLPCLLEDEGQRLNAQNVGLVEVVLSAMLQFPNSLKLHIAALHTMVLLARPLGGREGMLFDNSVAESSSDLGFGSGAASASSGRSESSAAASCASGRRKQAGINGIAIMLDSMRRFETEAKLQAVGCWALVNLALVPAQKTMIISLDGIRTTINAMLQHPHDYDVQFRALFALINLVVPCKSSLDLNPAHRMGPSYKTEKDVLDSAVSQIAELVVLAMKNFCSSQTILNRACLVLHNLSQSPDYVITLLWTRHCYQMLEWCIANHPTDNVLRRSAISSLHRLQVLLSGNESLRQRFVESVRAEQKLFHL